MGRGRAKAKQKKVARQLKYSSHAMDLDRLREEIVTADGPVFEDDDDTEEQGYPDEAAR